MGPNMSDMYPPDEYDGAEDDELPANDVEYEADETPALTCAICGRAIEQEYYEIKGETICGDCQEALELSERRGSTMAQFCRAVVFGLGAAVVGFAIYFAVLKITDHNFWLLSVLVGFIVGKGVWKGSKQRGGLLYQLLAVFLTYTAIGASFAALVIPHLAMNGNNQALNAKAGGRGNLAAPARAGQAPAPARLPRGAAIALYLSLRVLFALIIVYVSPVLICISSPINIAIIGVALFEAWQFNKRRPIIFSGPFVVDEDGDSAAFGAPSYA
jgi:hypothetical protein